jgi:tetratricopeptide (TPR) repeat protein
MKREIFVLALLFVAPRASHACLHYFDEDAPAPSATPSSNYARALQQHESREVWQARADERQKVADKLWDFRSQNNLSVALAHLGRLDEALERMQTVERAYPNQAATAYNFGTVYELKNEVDKAKFWTQEGIRRDRNTTGGSHLDGTEWLHLRILDAKKSLIHPAKNADSVSGLDFGDSRVPTAPATLPVGNGGAPLTLTQVQKALHAQLHERLEFVKAPDPIVGDLLFDLANTIAVNGDEESARDVYSLSLDFAPPRADLAQSRFDHFAGTPNYALRALIWIGALGVFVGYKTRQKWLEQQKWRAIPVQDLDEFAPAKRAAFIDCSKYDPHDRN